MKNVIIKGANILGGEPVFRGTRVPFTILIDEPHFAFRKWIAAGSGSAPPHPTSRGSGVGTGLLTQTSEGWNFFTYFPGRVQENGFG
jgi:hypothetical protein